MPLFPGERESLAALNNVVTDTLARLRACLAQNRNLPEFVRLSVNDLIDVAEHVDRPVKFLLSVAATQDEDNNDAVLSKRCRDCCGATSGLLLFNGRVLCSRCFDNAVAQG